MISENQNPLHIYILRKAIDLTETFKLVSLKVTPNEYNKWIPRTQLPWQPVIYCSMPRPSQSQAKDCDKKLKMHWDLTSCFSASLLSFHICACAPRGHMWSQAQKYVCSEEWNPEQIKVALMSTRQQTYPKILISYIAIIMSFPFSASQGMKL